MPVDINDVRSVGRDQLDPIKPDKLVSQITKERKRVSRLEKKIKKHEDLA